ncbi:MAG: hypothetical protein KA538_14150 [Azonexus sp.]|nr:hypothetical protein [Azonexus sp.]
MNRLACRYSFPILMLLAGNASAIGLGELRGQPALGDRIRLEISLLGAEKVHLDPACFRLVQPSSNGDLPWLKKAGLSVRKGTPPVLEIRSEVPLREPVLQIGVYIGCGHEVSREYVVMASPAGTVATPMVEPGRAGADVAPPTLSEVTQPAPPRAKKFVPREAEVPSRIVPRKPEKRPAGAALPDRLMLSDGTGLGEPSLRLSTALLAGTPEAKESQREILRLEYRMLMAMNEQAVSQMAAAEKLRNMEGMLGELQQRATDFAQRVEKDSTIAVGSAPNAAAQPPGQGSPAPAQNVPAQPAPKNQAVVGGEAGHSATSWGFYGALLGALLGLAGWYGWRRYRDQTIADGESDALIHVPEVKVDPKRVEEHEEPGGIDLPFEPVAMGMPMQVDVPLESAGENQAESSVAPAQAPARGNDSVMSINATTLDEHFEANPVMELADIMLSFGRVKGAAQALQEFIDNNPQEALQPWIRLMDVYRMAGMRAEFENVARNLNQHFNVEVQSWDEGRSEIEIAQAESAVEQPIAPRPQCLEDLPRLMNMVLTLWEGGDVVGYLYQLLRDNRGGQRSGFALPVVEDILFLIELKETANRMEVA